MIRIFTPTLGAWLSRDRNAGPSGAGGWARRFSCPGLSEGSKNYEAPGWARFAVCTGPLLALWADGILELLATAVAALPLFVILLRP